MIRYSVAAVLLISYVAASAWAVRRAGESYRESLKSDRLAARQAAIPAPEPPAQPEHVAAPSPGPDPTGMPETPTAGKAAVLPSPASDVPLPPQPAPSPALARARPAEAKVDVPPRASSPPSARGEAPGRNDVPPGADPVWDSPEVKRDWDLQHLTAEDEARLGRDLHALVLHSQRRVETGSMQRRVEEAAEPFLAARNRKDIDYTFTVLESDTVNAFSHPGGYVYVTSGLMDWIGEDQDSALEFIIAHEIAHVDFRHALACLEDPGVLKLRMGTLLKFFVLIFPRGYYPDRLDFEADAWAYQQMKRLDRTKRECLAFLRKLEIYASDKGFENGRVLLNKPDRDTLPIENHLRAHPAAYKRLKRLEDLTKPAPAR